MHAASLTRVEAEDRARLVAVTRYDIDVDLTGLLEGDTLHSVSTITFGCREPGASTFVDGAADVTRAVLNGRELDLAGVTDGRIPLPTLEADNVLVVTARSPTPAARAASSARSTRPTAWSTSGPASSQTRRAGCGGASTSPTSRHPTGSS